MSLQPERHIARDNNVQVKTCWVTLPTTCKVKLKNVLLKMVPFAFLIFICCQFALTIAEWEKFVAASSSDLTKLFEKEVSLISDLYHWTYLINEGKILRTSEIEHDLHVYNKIDADLKINQWVAENPYEYVSHPINAFHLMQRTTQLWPSVFENATTKSLEEIMEETVPQFPDEDDFLYGACVGLVNIELYYGSNGNSMLDLAMGKVFDPVEKKIYQAKHSLSSKDFYLIANAAKRGETYLYALDTFACFCSFSYVF